MAVGELHRLVEGRELGDADDRAERLGRVDLVVGGHADDERRVVEDPGVRIADEALARVVGGDPPARRGAVHGVVVLDEPEPVLEALGEALVDHRPVQHVLDRIADRRRRQPLGELRRRTRRRPTRARSRCRATCSAGPPCRSRRTARPRRPGRRRRRPSRPSGSCRRAPGTATAGCARTARRSREPTALEPVKPTLSIRPSSSAASSPANVSAPDAWTTFRTPPGTPPAWNSLRQRVAERGAVLRRLPDDRVAAQDRRHQVPGGHGDREVAGGDDRRHADRHPEREELLVRHLRRHGLPVQPPALAEEEVAGVDDLLDLAERLRDTACRSRA